MFVLKVEWRRPKGSWSGKSHEYEMSSTWFFWYITSAAHVALNIEVCKMTRTDFEQFLLCDSVVVGVVVWWSWKELILNSFYFGKVWWSWKNWFWTISILGGCAGLERTDFEQFLLWGCGGLEKNWFWTVSILGGCGGLERTDFEQFLFWEGVVVLKELTLNSFYFQRVWWSWNNIWEMHREVLGTYKGVIEYMGVLGASGDIRSCPNAWGHPNIWGCQDAPKHRGCQLNTPKCRTYMPLKKLGVFEHMGVLRWTGKHWGYTRGCWTYGLFGASG